MGDGAGIGVGFGLSVPTSHPILLAIHNHSPVRCCSAVRLTAGWMSCFRLTFKPRETWVTRFKPDGVFIPCILFKLFDFEHIDTSLKDKLSFRSHSVCDVAFLTVWCKYTGGVAPVEWSYSAPFKWPILNFPPAVCYIVFKILICFNAWILLSTPKCLTKGSSCRAQSCIKPVNTVSSSFSCISNALFRCFGTTCKASTHK